MASFRRTLVGRASPLLVALVAVLAFPARGRAEPPAPVPAAASDDVAAALATIAKGRTGLTSLQVPFTQERELSLLSSTVKSKGELLLVRPDKMRWRLEAPDDATYWVSKDGIAYRTADGAGKVSAGQAGGLAALLDDVLVVVGGDLDKIKTRYTLTASRAGDRVTLTLVPIADKVKKVVKRLIVTFDELGSPKRLVLEEPEGDATTIVFGDAKRNAKVDAALLVPR
jgi:outer membrane lipoprotein-sorting protein